MRRKHTTGLAFVLAFILILGSIPVLPATQTAAQAAAADDLRGVWIATVYSIDFPHTSGVTSQQQELRDILDTAKNAGLNAVFFQVRPTGDAYYQSEIFPWAKSLTGTAGKNPGWDPLAYLIEQAAARGMEVHAWINPYRLTEGSADKPNNDPGSLPSGHPVRENPSLAIAFDDGKLYLDPGNPDAVDLVVRGVEEIVRNYDVAGIHFDDYFYPSASVTKGGKSYTATFDDSASHAKYGVGRTLADWRRSNTRTLVEKVKSAVKAIDSTVVFGISPTGIWQNKKNSDLGSDTNGYESYNSLYADTRGWVKDGLLDYIAPQLYWVIGQSGSDYDILVRWWSNVVSGTGVKLYIGHAAYQVGSSTKWNNVEEIPNQLALNESLGTVSGDIYYGYSKIKENTLGLATRLSQIYAAKDAGQIGGTATAPTAPATPVVTVPDEMPAPGGAPTVTELVISAPSNGAKTTADKTYIIGAGDPNYPITVNGETIARTESGYFSLFVPLSMGTNNFVFEHRGKTTNYSIVRNSASSGSGSSSALQSHTFLEGSLFPTTDRRYAPGETYTLSAVAPSGMSVSATVDGTVIALKPGEIVSSAGAVTAQRYTATVTMQSRSGYGLINLGKAKYSFNYNGAAVSASSSHDIYCYIVDPLLVGTIQENSKTMRTSNSSSATRKTPLWAGVSDYIIWETGEYYQFRYGGWTLKSNVTTTRRQLPDNIVTSMIGYATAGVTMVRWKMPVGAPFTIRELDDAFEITFHNTTDNRSLIVLPTNPLFQAVSFKQSGDNAVYTFKTKQSRWIFGYTVSHTAGYMTITFRNPPSLGDAEAPLLGKTIVVDAGHGGSDRGAAGPLGSLGDAESGLNLRVALALEKKLRALGADVIMLRSTDANVSLEERAAAIRQVKPMVAVSLHHNSVDYSSDISKCYGNLTLYSEDFSARFAEVVHKELLAATGSRDMGAKFQGLAVCRIQECPSILIELGFVTNPYEYELLSTDYHIAKSVKGIANGILAFANN